MYGSTVPALRGTSQCDRALALPSYARFKSDLYILPVAVTFTMPRRPRPASRRPPAPTAQQASAAKRSLQLQPARKARQPSEELEDPAFASASGSEDFFEDGDKGSVLLGNVPEGDEDSASEDEVLDVDGARVAQWVDDDELDQASEVESEAKSDASEEEPRHTVREDC